MKVFPLQLWRSWTEQILTPRIPEAELNAKLAEVRQLLPIPVFWLLGKAQSGKTSIISTLTGASSAEVGNGFQPCTQTARFFDFPDSQSAFIRFLDTRGLAEIHYDPTDDMAWCEQQSHLLIIVVKAMDHQQDSVLEAAQAVRKLHPDWPIIVAQTCLHEGYPNRDMEHIQPYAFEGVPFAPGVPPDLARSLLKQRQAFANLNAHFVALDFTLPEDGYVPVDYGVDALWRAIEDIWPQGLRNLLVERDNRQLLNDDYAHKAHPHIIGYALCAGAAAALPLPAASLATATAIQAKLFHSIASIYGLKLTSKSVAEVGSAVGLSVLAGMGWRELTKLIPGYGQTIALGVDSLYTAAVTYALGRVFCQYFADTQRGHAFSTQVLRELYREESQRGRNLLAHSLKRAEP